MTPFNVNWKSLLRQEKERGNWRSYLGLLQWLVFPWRWR